MGQNVIARNAGQTLSGSLHYYGKRQGRRIAPSIASGQVLVVTSFPPRECGIATYSADLIKALENNMDRSVQIRVCAIESQVESQNYPDIVRYILDSGNMESYKNLASLVNSDDEIILVLIQHEFGLFRSNEESFMRLLKEIRKPILIAYHTVLPNPNDELKKSVIRMAEFSSGLIVMTNTSATILENEYDIHTDLISIIPHGIHLVENKDVLELKRKYDFTGRIVLSTFGLISSGKGIETTLQALPEIISQHPTVLFLIIGKTHPTVVTLEGEQYREMLQGLVRSLRLEDHVIFLNYFVPLQELLDILQLSDIYLFTSKDPNQAVSGTFSYATSCGCAIISTPIPHAKEILQNDAGVIVDFGDSAQLSKAVNALLEDAELKSQISSNGLHRMAPAAWENSAIAHARLFRSASSDLFDLTYAIPSINLSHIENLTTDVGIIQFAVLGAPDITSGYTLDDNARAMIAICEHYDQSRDEKDLRLIRIYFDFLKNCLQSEGYFLNYVDEHWNFTRQNEETNLADSNGRAIWAIGFLISKAEILPNALIWEAEEMMNLALKNAHKIHSTRAMAFIIKGLFYRNLIKTDPIDLDLIERIADKMVKMYQHEASKDWSWFESYLTYANSLLPEALLCAWMSTGNLIYRDIAKSSFDFLLSKIMHNDGISVISNKGWYHRGDNNPTIVVGGEQPIDVAYTILALSKFYEVFEEEEYRELTLTSMSWFHGNNHLGQIVYNPCTGGCYDGLEDTYININQGAESTVSYLLARLEIAKFQKGEKISKVNMLSSSMLVQN